MLNAYATTYAPSPPTLGDQLRSAAVAGEYTVSSVTTVLTEEGLATSHAVLEPITVHPNPYDFRGVPAGEYYLCAYIDPDDLITETHSGDSDNNLKSEVTVTVQDCP